MGEKLLEVKNLTTRFRLDDGVLTAVDNVSFHIERGETLGIVGESGCGKSVTSYSVLDLVAPPGKVEAGEIFFEGTDLRKITHKEMRQICGNDIAMIFQEPMTSLNPVFTVGEQIAEVLRLHQGLSRLDAKARSIELLHMVNIPLPEQRFKEYPHQLSGGMRQRVVIAMALACNPKLLICDEPTTALDVTVQAQILRLIRKLQKELNMSVMLITHDLAVISETADRVIVMYAGRIVEENDGQDIFVHPLHPYTQALLKSIPTAQKAGEALFTIEGMVPNLLKKHTGCLFAPRCAYAQERCFQEEPALMKLGDGCEGRRVRCFRYHDKKEGADEGSIV